MSNTIKSWWKEGIVYQVYPRSFKDGNGDGIGDLKGIIEKLDYLQGLGITIIWLSPVYKSPNDDNGYDISDYRDIMKEFGTMEEFELLLAEMKKRDLKLLMDLVVNHSSDEHSWFEESCKSKDNSYRDYYTWKPGKNGGPPNNWVSFFGGSAWQLDEQTNEYYLHLFSKKQPDLNWENPKLRQEVYDIMKFWLEKGVDGFRMDVIPLISKDTTFPDFPDDYDGNFPVFYANGPRVHEFLQEMNSEVLSKYDVMTVGEGIGVSIHEANDYVGSDRSELNMIFHFDHMFLDRSPDDFFIGSYWRLTDFKGVFLKWDEALGNLGWNSIFLGNHDFPRLLSRFGDDEKYRVESAKLFATLLMTMKGTPYIYQGDEIGMTNYPFKSIDECQDIQSVNTHKEKGDTYLHSILKFTRDHARTPVQWNDSKNAGFSNADPWLTVNPNYREINIERDLKTKGSVVNYYKQMIQLRKNNALLVYGDLDIIDYPNENIFAYTRKLENTGILVILNFKDQLGEFKLPHELDVELKWMIGNYDEQPQILKRIATLHPYEAVVYKLLL